MLSLIRGQAFLRTCRLQGQVLKMSPRGQERSQGLHLCNIGNG